MDLEEFRRTAHLTVDAMCDYFANVEKLPVVSQVQPGYLKPLLKDEVPEKGETYEEIMKDFQVRDRHLISKKIRAKSDFCERRHQVNL